MRGAKQNDGSGKAIQWSPHGVMKRHAGGLASTTEDPQEADGFAAAPKGVGPGRVEDGHSTSCDQLLPQARQPMIKVPWTLSTNNSRFMAALLISWDH